MYSTPDDMRLLYPEESLVNMASESRGRSWESQEVQANLLEAIDQADGEIDGYVGVAVPLPLEKVPKIISNLSAKMAVYNVIRRRRDEIPPAWEGEYKNCVALLNSIASGRLKLMSGTATEETDVIAGPVVVSTRPSSFPADTWEKY